MAPVITYEFFLYKSNVQYRPTKKLQIILAGTETMPPEVAAVSSADGRRRLVLVGDPGAEFPATPAQAVVLRALGRRQAAVTGRPRQDRYVDGWIYLYVYIYIYMFINRWVKRYR